jgi:hypothetical protein
MRFAQMREPSSETTFLLVSSLTMNIIAIEVKGGYHQPPSPD